MSGAARCLAAMLFLAATPARAQDAARSEAEALFRDANGRLREGDYAGALDLYERAYARLPSPRILVNMATAQRALGRRAEAADLYARVLAAPAGEVSDQSRAETQRILRDLDIELGRVRVLVAVDGARVRVGERDMGTAPLPAPVHVEPGEHLVRVEHEGFRATTSRAVVSAGEIVDVSVVLVEIPPTVEPETGPTDDDDPDRRDGSVLGAWWFWTGVGLIVAGAAVGGIVIAGGS